MSDFSLAAQLPLGGYDRDFGGVSLVEPAGLALVSVATPLAGEKALAKSISSAFGVSRPEMGMSSLSKDGKARFLRLQPDQMFLLFEHEGDDAGRWVSDKLGETAYCTDQSDSWTLLRVLGPRCRAALERICMLDLHPDIFALDAVARTTMEHLAVIILRDGPDSFVMMSPRSSAACFLHALETSIGNIGQ